MESLSKQLLRHLQYSTTGIYSLHLLVVTCCWLQYKITRRWSVMTIADWKRHGRNICAFHSPVLLLQTIFVPAWLLCTNRKTLHYTSTVQPISCVFGSSVNQIPYLKVNVLASNVVLHTVLCVAFSRDWLEYQTHVLGVVWMLNKKMLCTCQPSFLKLT